MNVNLSREEMVELIKELGDSPLVPKFKRILKSTNKPFHITSVTRSDLEEKYHPKLVSLLKDDDMECLAHQMAEAYLESNQFWNDMEICAESFLLQAEVEHINNIPRRELPLHIDCEWFTSSGKALIEKRLKE